MRIGDRDPKDVSGSKEKQHCDWDYLLVYHPADQSNLMPDFSSATDMQKGSTGG